MWRLGTDGDTIATNDIPPALVVNVDQTGCHLRL
jgi:hypothetical protein